MSESRSRIIFGTNRFFKQTGFIGTGLRFCRSLTWGLEERHLLFLLLHMQHVELVFPPIKIRLLPLIINGIMLITTDYHNTVGFHTGNFKAQILPFQSKCTLPFCCKGKIFLFLFNQYSHPGNSSTVQA